MRSPVDLRAWVVPGVEHCPDGARELLTCVLRERGARLLLVKLFEGRDHLLQVGRREIDVLLRPAPLLELGQRLFEATRVDAVDDLAVHLDQPPIRILGESLVSGSRTETLERVVVEPEVEDCVHHPRHRDRGS
jgi:hypothetical protein